MGEVLASWVTTPDNDPAEGMTYEEIIHDPAFVVPPERTAMSLRLPAELIERIDDARGEQSRNAWIAQTCEQRLDRKMVVTVQLDGAAEATTEIERLTNQVTQLMENVELLHDALTNHVSVLN